MAAKWKRRFTWISFVLFLITALLWLSCYDDRGCRVVGWWGLTKVYIACKPEGIRCVLDHHSRANSLAKVTPYVYVRRPPAPTGVVVDSDTPVRFGETYLPPQEEYPAPPATWALGGWFGARSAGTSMFMDEVEWEYGASVPYWWLLVLFGIPAASMIPSLARRWKRSRVAGLCLCGYDLRASSERCPECGRDIASLPQARRPWEKRAARVAYRVLNHAPLIPAAILAGIFVAAITVEPPNFYSKNSRMQPITIAFPFAEKAPPTRFPVPSTPPSSPSGKETF